MDLSSRLLKEGVEALSGLPSIGRRTALRLALHLLKQPTAQTHQLCDALKKMVDCLHFCEKCHNISDGKICDICNNPKRDQQVVCVVEDIRDVMAIEATGQYQGGYHVLGGRIAPVEGISPNDLNIDSLIHKVTEEQIKEVILALSATVEGDTTNFYIYKRLKHLDVKVSAIAKGIAVGYELQYTDELTLGRSIIQRVDFESYLGL